MSDGLWQDRHGDRWAGNGHLNIRNCDSLEQAFFICREKNQPIVVGIPGKDGQLIYKVFPSGRAVGPLDLSKEVSA